MARRKRKLGKDERSTKVAQRHSSVLRFVFVVYLARQFVNYAQSARQCAKMAMIPISNWKTLCQKIEHWRDSMALFAYHRPKLFLRHTVDS